MPGSDSLEGLHGRDLEELMEAYEKYARQSAGSEKYAQQSADSGVPKWISDIPAKVGENKSSLFNQNNTDKRKPAGSDSTADYEAELEMQKNNTKGR